MLRQTKPDFHQLKLGLLSETPVELPPQLRSELAAALADMLLQAIKAPEAELASAEVGNESEVNY
jgi:hypothetical protein